MNVRIQPPDTGTDRPVQVLAAVAIAVAAIGALSLMRSAIGDMTRDYRTVRVDNQTGLAVQVDALDAAGGRMGLGLAGPRATTGFQEVLDLGRTWTFVASYGGQEVARQQLTGRELAAAGWTVQIPGKATADLEAAGFR
jgi:hypothetical protein